VGAGAGVGGRRVSQREVAARLEIPSSGGQAPRSGQTNRLLETPLDAEVFGHDAVGARQRIRDAARSSSPANRGFEAWGEILGDAMVAATLIDPALAHRRSARPNRSARHPPQAPRDTHQRCCGQTATEARDPGARQPVEARSVHDLDALLKPPAAAT
jgi:hypothetical protein